jgi:hypothetical protein
MSSRAQIFFKQTGVYLYDHHGADRDAILAALQGALKSKAFRLGFGESAVLAVITLRYMMKGTKEAEGWQSFGIATGRHDDIELLVEVDCKKQEINIIRNPNATKQSERRYGIRKSTITYKFNDFSRRRLKEFTESD